MLKLVESDGGLEDFRGFRGRFNAENPCCWSAESDCRCGEESVVGTDIQKLNSGGTVLEKCVQLGRLNGIVLKHFEVFFRGWVTSDSPLIPDGDGVGQPRRELNAMPQIFG